MAHIFISYSKQDVEFMRYLKTLLEAQGYSVWVDEAQLTPSVRWWKTIEQNIMECVVFVILMSPNANESDWVEREILMAESQDRPIIPVLLAGNPWPRLANIQFEDMRAGLRAKLSPRFISTLQGSIGKRSEATQKIIFRIEQGDVKKFEADVMAFKYARSFHGADMVVAEALLDAGSVGENDLMPKPGEYQYVPTKGAIAAENVLYIGTPRLSQFRYPQIQAFASDTLNILAKVAPKAHHLAMTVHGPGFGLDGNESIISQLLGYLQAIQAPTWSMGLEQITIVERNGARVEQMRAAIDTLLEDATYATALDSGWGYWLNTNIPAAEMAAPAAAKLEKDYSFIIMPLENDDDDLYIYGIQTPIHAHGLLCERSVEPIDMQFSALVDDLKNRVEKATVVVVELTKADPSVYTQLGYVWRTGIPTILLLKEGEKFHFEMPPNVIRYRKIRDADTAISEALDQLKADGKI